MSAEELFASAIDFVIFALPILIPIAMLIFLYNFWVAFARKRFISQQETVLLQIIPPRDVFKTPLSMELVINSFYQTFGEADIIEKYWKGSVRPWFSLEIASNGGEVGFYVWTRRSAAGFIQSQLYAQYPGIEVAEVEDYAQKVDFESGGYSMWATEFQFTQPDPVPIKTYIDYGLDKTAEEEEKTDPITPMLEWLGSLRPGEYGWVQIIIRAHKGEDKDPTKWFGQTDSWVDTAGDLIKKIRNDSVVEFKDGDNVNKVPLATKGQVDKINAIERSLGKTPFDCGVRGIYIAEKELFDGVNIGGLIGSFKHYSSANLNGFKPGVGTKKDWWRPDPFDRRIKAIRKEMIDAYRERGYFFRQYLGKYRKKLVMNSEELATLYHFPGSVAQTPSLRRVQSKKGEAPSDLPI